jgi:ATP-binding cassette subfamily F protein 3
MISLRQATLRRGAATLLEDVTWTLFPKQRIGIIGSNGCGKTSLFALLLDQLHLDVGELDIAKDIEIAHVEQEIRGSSHSALEYVLSGDTELQDLSAKLTIAEHENDGLKIAELHQSLDHIDAYSANARAAQLLSGLGFTTDSHIQVVNDFSGGWRVRLNIAKALMCRSDILLLDEPTNHLDLDAVLWLETWLQAYAGTLLIISHDREFLDAVVNHIAHISHKSLKLYTGNYSAFERQRAEQLALQQLSFDKQQKKLNHMHAFVDRFRYKATKAKQAQSRLKAIEKLTLVSAVQEDQTIQFTFKEPKPGGNPLIDIRRADVGYDQKIILHQINLSISPKDRIAFIGPNGAGKSTLIKVLAGNMTLQAGILEVNPHLKIGYFAQHQIDYLQLNATPLGHLQMLALDTSEQDLRTYLGSFGFTKNRITEQIHHFSGGEKSRLALALLIWQKPNLLLLDEPTNHLDLDMRHALSIALQQYTGAMIIVSHDRFLIKSTVDDLMLIANGKVEKFTGDLADYQQWLADYRRTTQPVSALKTENTKKEKRQDAAKNRKAFRPTAKKLASLELAMTISQKRLSEIETRLAESDLYLDENKPALHQLLAEQISLAKDLTQLENDYLALL